MSVLWAGVDVGGRRKGFHAALVDSERLVARAVLKTPDETARWLINWKPRLVAVDSPLSPAHDGERSREGERLLVAAGICSLRYTPDRAGLASNPVYHEWIEHGFLLHERVRQAGLAVIECYPTASWTQWAGRRGKKQRAAWSQEALATLGLLDVPPAMTQDERDAIGAALTARAHDLGETESFGDIVVPVRGRGRWPTGGSPGRVLELGPEHALISGLREGGSEVEVTRALASVLAHEKRMAAQFVRLVIESAPRGKRIDLRDLPEELSCVAEQHVAEGIADLTFSDDAGRWHAIVEIKIHAGYGHDQIERYLKSFHADSHRNVLVAITRNVPTYGDSEGEDPHWAGSVRWAKLLARMRELTPANKLLADQWPLFLDVLEKEGSMGFTSPQASLFQAWSQYPQARKHIVDFINTVREPLEQALSAAIAAAPGEKPRPRLVTRGKSKVAVAKYLGKILVRFDLGPPGPEWIQAGVWGWGEPRFFVELPYPKGGGSSEAAAEVTAALREQGFESWKEQILSCYLPLDDALLQATDIEDHVLRFASRCFEQIATSGILELESTAVEELLEADTG